MTAFLPVQEVYNRRREFRRNCTGRRRARRVAAVRAFNALIYPVTFGFSTVMILNAFGWFQ